MCPDLPKALCIINFDIIAQEIYILSTFFNGGMFCLKFTVCVYADATAEKLRGAKVSGRPPGRRQDKKPAAKMTNQENAIARSLCLCMGDKESHRQRKVKNKNGEKNVQLYCIYVLNGELVRAAVFAANRTYPWHGHAPLAQLLLIHT
jgi:hypothetical protein